MSESGSRKSVRGRSGVSGSLGGHIVGSMDSEVLKELLAELERRLERRMASLQSHLEEHMLKETEALTKVLERQVESPKRGRRVKEEEEEVGDGLVEDGEGIEEKEKEPRDRLGKEKQ